MSTPDHKLFGRYCCFILFVVSVAQWVLINDKGFKMKFQYVI